MGTRMGTAEGVVAVHRHAGRRATRDMTLATRRNVPGHLNRYDP